MSALGRLAAVTALAVASAGPAFAETRIAVPCPNGVPCEFDIYGHIDTVGAAHLPWTASVVVPADVCLKVGTVAGDGPDDVNVVTPDGKIATHHSGYAEINPTIAGWHTIDIDSLASGGEQLFRARISFEATRTCQRSTPR